MAASHRLPCKMFRSLLRSPINFSTPGKRAALVFPRLKRVTSWPRVKAASTRWRPKNRVPPITRMFKCVFSFTKWDTIAMVSHQSSRKFVIKRCSIAMSKPSKEYKDKPEIEEDEYEEFDLLERLESLREDMEDLGVTTLAEVIERIEALHRRLDTK